MSFRGALTVPVVCVVLALAGCGTDDPPRGPAAAGPDTVATSSDTPSETRAPTSQPPTFTEAGWYGTHPLRMDDSIEENVLKSRAIILTGTTGRDWSARQYTGGLNHGWFLVYRKAAVSAGTVRAPASDCTMPVQGHPGYCIGSAAAYGIHLYGDDPLEEGIYQATRVLLFDQNTSRIDTDNGTVPAGQKFRVVLDSRMLAYRPDTFESGDIAVVWLDSTTRDDSIRGFKELPVDAFLPVTS
ncbi:hypothetical protein [Amycolatopsis sp. NPDC021455]|uniref:hypothetical protein n=1 Tax=Amycolatopsis sp. NPDC021455 TaxID=3154901 RepID=UPI0033CC9503